MTPATQTLLADCAKALTTARLHYEFEAGLRGKRGSKGYAKSGDDKARTLRLAERAGELVGRIDDVLETELVTVNEGRPESNAAYQVD